MVVRGSSFKVVKSLFVDEGSSWRECLVDVRYEEIPRLSTCPPRSRWSSKAE